MTRMRWARRLAAAGLVAALVAGCGQRAAPVDVSFQGVQPLDPVEVRIQLEQLLGQHVLVAVRLMRARIADQPDVLENAIAAIDDNTADLAALLEPLSGPDAAAEFSRLWSDHTGEFFNYARSLADDDADAAQAAADALTGFETGVSDVIAGATDGALSAADVEARLATHVEQLLAQADAFAAGDYEQSYSLEREAFSHMFQLGQTLSGGFSQSMPEMLPTAPEGAGVELRAALGRLLGEHVELAIDALRAGAVDAPEFDAAAGALNANTAEVTGAIDGIYGPDAASEFNRIWADHIDLFVRYAGAVAAADEDTKTDVRGALTTYGQQLGGFFETATGGRVAAEDVVALLGQHDTQVLSAVEAYVAEDYATATRLSYEGYQHMFAVAAGLAAAIEGGAMAAAPSGGADTGGGGARHR